MFSLEIECPPGGRDLLIADLWEQGSAGIVELDDVRLRAFFDDHSIRDALLARYPGAAWRFEEQRDWVEAAREKLPPMLVGNRFFLVPEWRDDPTPPGRLRIVVNPGMAFGTGFHETTQLCIEAMERCVRPGMALLDVGTGSGILAQAGQLLGAAPVFGCDTDALAIEVARRNLRSAFVGSVDAVRSGIAGVVVANISPEAILELAPDLFRVLKPAGTALLSGFESRQVELIQNALPGAGDVHIKGEWALVALHR
jgi:ribosomal protein L11 methyltransferase